MIVAPPMTDKPHQLPLFCFTAHSRDALILEILECDYNRVKAQYGVQRNHGNIEHERYSWTACTAKEKLSIYVMY